MSLKKQRVVSLHAESTIGDTRVIRLTSTVTSDDKVNSSYSETILNAETYKANRDEVRADIQEFREAVYELEDQMIEEAKKAEPEEPVDPEEPEEPVDPEEEA